MGHKIKREVRKCLVCQTEFEIKPNNRKKMCSDECRKIWGARPENKEFRIKKTQEVLKKNFENEDYKKNVIGKRKKTNLERYGFESHTQNEEFKEKIKNHYLEKYGVENFMQLPENVEKIKQTKKERFGDENYNNRPKALETTLAKYDVEYAIQNPDVLKLRNQNNIEKYGQTIFNNHEKAKQTNLDKYGTEYTLLLSSCTRPTKWDFEDLALKKRIDEANIALIGEFSGKSINGINIRYNFKCNTCGNEFTSTFSAYQAPICRKCLPIKSHSSINLAIKSILDEYKIEYQDNTKLIIGPLELDFYIPVHNLAIEVNGNYYHSEMGNGKDKNYHINKTKLCNEIGIKLIHIFEDEIVEKFDIVKSRILNLLKKTDNRVYARNCKIKEINDKEKGIFLIKNHIQGNCSDSHRYGLYYKDELVSLMTFGQNRMSKVKTAGEFELIRFCNKLNTNVIGGFSKLLKYFIKEINPKKIITFSDNRWSGINYTNTVYTINGFNFVHQTQPSYFYLQVSDYFKRENRLKYTKQNLIKLFGYNGNQTEWEIAQENGMDRIWDCGTIKYEMNF